MSVDNDSWRLAVKLKSRSVLMQYMEFRDIRSVRQLEVACANVKSKNKGRLPKRGILGHLVSGKRATCKPRTAQVIEEALGCPRGLLFEPSVSKVVGNTRRKEAA